MANPLSEYLMSVRRPGGRPIARLGTRLTTVPIFPPNTSVTYKTFPFPPGAFANIWIWWKFSPSMVPGAFSINIAHAGLERFAGVFGSTLLSQGWETVMDVTTKEPIISIISNVSGLSQFFEAHEGYLIIDTEADWILVQKIRNAWGRGEQYLV